MKISKMTIRQVVAELQRLSENGHCWPDKDNQNLWHVNSVHAQNLINQGRSLGVELQFRPEPANEPAVNKLARLARSVARQNPPQPQQRRQLAAC